MLGRPIRCRRRPHPTDSFYSAWPVKRQGWVDAVCYLVCSSGPGRVLVVTWDYFTLSYARNERIVTSRDADRVSFKLVMRSRPRYCCCRRVRVHQKRYAALKERAVSPERSGSFRSSSFRRRF